MFLHKTFDDTPSEPWLEGALAGMVAVGRGPQSWAWQTFLQSLRDMVKASGVRTKPLTLLLDEAGARSPKPLSEVMGGYISVAGMAVDRGVAFQVPLPVTGTVNALLGSVTVRTLGELALLFHPSVARLQRVVPLRGPVCSVSGGEYG
ncbi:MAG: hypothetical protein ACP6IT_11075 [Candidatus Thorarchaeota archaeon]